MGVVEFNTPTFAVLEPHEVDEAMHAAGIVGVINALLAKSPDLDPATIEAVGRATTWLPVARVRDAIENHRRVPEIDHRDSLEFVARSVVALELVTSAMQDVGMWLARSPGQVEPDHTVYGGTRRAFATPAR